MLSSRALTEFMIKNTYKKRAILRKNNSKSLEKERKYGPTVSDSRQSRECSQEIQNTKDMQDIPRKYDKDNCRKGEERKGRTTRHSSSIGKKETKGRQSREESLGSQGSYSELRNNASSNLVNANSTNQIISHETKHLKSISSSSPTLLNQKSGTESMKSIFLLNNKMMKSSAVKYNQRTFKTLKMEEWQSSDKIILIKKVGFILKQVRL